MIVSTLAFFADCLIGDPDSRFHPVILIGRLISGLEKLFYREADSDKKKMLGGGLLVVCVLTAVWWISVGILSLAGMNKYVFLIVAALLLKATISPRSLAKAGREIYDCLMSGDIVTARKKTGWIVGRDTDKLSVAEVTRATVETVAENITDGIISPLFYFAIGGVPLAMLYRAANTMDSMVGYKNDKYLHFGRIAARLDDVLNFIPARITGILLVISALILGYDYRNAWTMLIRDAGKHPSPNSGYCEATVAGALNIRLGGLNYYFGQPSFRAYMGDAHFELGPGHIISTIRLMYTATVLFLCILLCW